MGSGEGEAAGARVNVKFSGRSIWVDLVDEWSVKDLKCHLQTLTNVLPRGQKLIFKGQVLVDDSSSLKSFGVTDGSKIMLMASQGLHQGNAPITSAPAPATLIKTSSCSLKSQVIQIDETRLERWKRAGVISLSESQLEVIPCQVWSCGSSVKFLDVSQNNITDLPAAIGSLTGLRKLLLNGNNLHDAGVAWDAISLLPSLIYLTLRRNNFTSLPTSLGSWTSLRELDFAYNNITSLPLQIGLLTKLELLKANNNQIASIPSSIGDCSSLYHLDLSSNLFHTLPHSIGNLHNLTALHLRRTALTSLPSTLFTGCSKLTTLDLHATEITLDSLRQFEGWDDYDARRCDKVQKQLDFSVASSDKFDEAADKD